MVRHTVLWVTARFLIPLIILFALYVQFHGEYGPGGGFQAGVIFGAAFVLYALVFGIDQAERVAPVVVLRAIAAAGLALYIGVGVVTVLMGGAFLEYGALLDDPVDAQHLGILVIELGVGLTVAAVMMLIFFSFVGRGRD